MKRFAYRIAQTTFEANDSRDAQILKPLNMFGAEGWRISRLEVAPRLAVNERAINVLLEREVTE